MRVDRKNIWNFKQNKPSLVVKDICLLYPLVEEEIIYKILLSRGIFKWLSVRRKLIVLKNIWKSKINKSLEDQRVAKSLYMDNAISYQKGYRKALEECRAEIRALCHSDRWQAPDFDNKANEWLDSYGE